MLSPKNQHNTVMSMAMVTATMLKAFSLMVVQKSTAFLRSIAMDVQILMGTVGKIALMLT